MANKKQSILTQAKFKLAKMLKLDFATVVAESGETLYIDGEATQGAEVFVLDDAGQYVAAPDGTYTENGVSYVVANGIIQSVSTAEEFENAEDLTPAPESVGEVTSEDVNEVVEVVNDILDVVKEQDTEIDELIDIVNELADEVVELRAEMKKYSGSTNGKPVEKQKFQKKSGKGIDFANQRMKKLVENFK